MPYGSLTGIRPTKLYHETLEKGLDAEDYFFEYAQGVARQSKLNQAYMRQSKKDYYYVKNNEVDVFVNIPICVSRCSYCSFISAELKRIRQFVTPYCDILIDELRCTKKNYRQNGIESFCRFILAEARRRHLTISTLERIIRESKFDCDEYTVEAGRP